MVCIDRAIEILRAAGQCRGPVRIGAYELATLYMNKALVVSGLGGQPAQRWGCMTGPSEILERLVNVEGRRELADDLAKLYTNKAIAVMRLGRQAGCGGFV